MQAVANLYYIIYRERNAVGRLHDSDENEYNITILPNARACFSTLNRSIAVIDALRCFCYDYIIIIINV